MPTCSSFAAANRVRVALVKGSEAMVAAPTCDILCLSAFLLREASLSILRSIAVWTTRSNLSVRLSEARETIKVKEGWEKASDKDLPQVRGLSLLLQNLKVSGTMKYKGNRVWKVSWLHAAGSSEEEILFKGSTYPRRQMQPNYLQRMLLQESYAHQGSICRNWLCQASNEKIIQAWSCWSCWQIIRSYIYTAWSEGAIYLLQHQMWLFLLLLLLAYIFRV